MKKKRLPARAPAPLARVHAPAATPIASPIATPIASPIASLAAALIAALALSACALPPAAGGGDALATAATAGSAWRHAPDAAADKAADPAAVPPGWLNTAQAQAWQSGQWWLLWPDAELAALMPRVEADNQTLAQARANLAQAQALLRQQQALLLPGLSASASQQRSGGDEQPGASSARLGLAASWEPDLWGRLSANVQAQAATAQARAADLAAARLAAQASLAQAYFSLRLSDAEDARLQAIIQGYERAARITQNRYDAGIAARTDALQAQNTLHVTRAARIALQRSRTLSEHAIALLIGQTPASFHLPARVTGARSDTGRDGDQDAGPDTDADADLDAQDPAQVALPAIPPGLPAALLLRRPDLAAARHNVLAANARIGAARAAYFPQLTLTGALNASGNTLANIVNAPQLLWSLGLSLAQQVFDGGQRSAALEQAKAAHDAATAAYRQSALAAIKEVEDQLASLHSLAAQARQLQDSVQVARRIERQIFNRYQSGLAAYSEVVTAQASALNARRNLLQLQLQRQQATVALIQALGGGWQDASLPSPNAEATP